MAEHKLNDDALDEVSGGINGDVNVNTASGGKYGDSAAGNAQITDNSVNTTYNNYNSKAPDDFEIRIK